MRRSPLAATRPGFTLVELIVVMGGAGVLMTGLFSAIYIALKASDTSLTPAAATIQGNATMTSLLSELQFARSFSERTTTAITFSVPGRDGESTSETIRYAWSGTPGDPLTRQYNEGTVAKLIDNVYAFQHDIPSPFPNLLSNADMDAGTNHWEAIPGATMVGDSTVGHTEINTSLYCFRNSSNDESGVRQDVTEQIVNGTRYEIGAWLRKWSSSQPFGAKVQLHIVSSGGGEQLFSSEQFTINNTDFKWVYGTVTPIWTGSLLSAYWEASGVSNIQDLYVDDARMRVKPLAGQSVNISLQVGSDPRSRIESGVLLRNSPL